MPAVRQASSSAKCPSLTSGRVSARKIDQILKTKIGSKIYNLRIFEAILAWKKGSKLDLIILDFLADTLTWDQPRIVSVYFFFSFETKIFEIGPLSPSASER